MKLLIVDDDALITQSLKVLLNKEADFDVIDTASNGREAIESCETAIPDIILMDLRMPVMDGIQSTEMIKERWPDIKIMVLTTFRDEKDIRQALKAGAEGYLLKSASVDNMAEQIRALAAGSTVLNADVLKTIMEPQHKPLEELTDRENDIIYHIAQGLSNKEIAETLYLSEGTVRNMLSVVLDKLEIRDRTQLAIYYWQSKQE